MTYLIMFVRREDETHAVFTKAHHHLEDGWMHSKVVLLLLDWKRRIISRKIKLRSSGMNLYSWWPLSILLVIMGIRKRRMMAMSIIVLLIEVVWW